MNLKLMTMSAVDFLDQWFESDVLKAPMAVSGIIGTYLGVKSPGTAYVLLHHYMGEIDGAFRSWGYSKGGTGGLSMACARAAESHGVEIRTEASVAEVSIKNGRARGVLLANGEEIEAKTVLSSCDPNLTFLRLVGERHLDEEFTTQIKRYKLRGSSGKVNLAVDRLPEFFGREGTAHLRGDIAIAPGIDYLERAYDEAKYGEFSSKPYINIVIPSIMDPSVARSGETHHLDVRAVRAIRDQRRAGDLARETGGLRRYRGRHPGRVLPGAQGIDSVPAGINPLGHGAGLRAYRGQYFPG